MNRVRVAVAAAVTFLSACSGSEKRGAGAADTAASMADMADMHNTGGTQNMEGMPGMAMGGDGPIRVTARQAALAGVTFAVAREAPIERTVRAVAMAVPNERGLAIVNARVSGWVEKLYANETGRLV
ncbi:MAG TPA: hypothetical protein VGA20_10660, partial [Gemmatimonadales bacterium]